MNTLSKSSSQSISFVTPSAKKELNGELGLTLHEVAQSLQIEYFNAKKKLDKMLETNRIVGIPYGISNDSNGMEIISYVLNVNNAKFFVAKYDNEIGDSYTRFLIDCEEFTLRLAKKAADSKMHATDEFEKYHKLASLLGLKDEQAAIHANHAIKKIHGIDALALIEYKPQVQEKTKSLMSWLRDHPLKLSSRRANLLLSEAGYLNGESGNWSLSEKGKRLGGVMVSQESNGKMRQSIEWPESILNILDALTAC